MKRRVRASILVGLLWCLALVSVIVIGVLHTARLDLLVVKNHGDLLQAHYLALAGIEKAKALLYQEATERRRSGRNHSGQLYSATEEFKDVAMGRGRFRVYRAPNADETGPVVYGIDDEESRLNVNVASADEFARIQSLTPDLVAAILDWRDADNAVTPGGAEADYYLGLQPPYVPRNGPFQTVRELLMVRGISTALLLGQDSSQPAGLGSSPGSTSPPSEPGDDAPVVSSGGLADILTVDSTVQNVNASGTDRVNVQTADEAVLTRVRGITPDIAKAIVSYRGQNRIGTLADLLDVAAMPAGGQPGGQNPGQPQVSMNPGGANPGGNQPTGPKLINESLLMDIADDVTTDGGQDLPGLININTASLAVLYCLPGVDTELARAIIAYRQSNDFFPNVAWLLKVPGMTRQLFKQIAPRLTARSETFRILSEGIVTSTGARQRIQVIVHLGSTDFQTLAYSENP